MSRKNREPVSPSVVEARPRIAKAAAGGVTSDEQFSSILDALICDIAEGALTDNQGRNMVGALSLKLKHAIAKAKLGRTADGKASRQLIEGKAA